MNLDATERNALTFGRLQPAPASASPAVDEDRIFVRGFRVEARIGGLEHERRARQSLHVDLELGLLNSRCCRTDALTDAVDYGQVLATVRRVALLNHCVLLEALAQDVADTLLAEFAIKSVVVSLSKAMIFEPIDCVGVSIRRCRPACGV